MDERSTSLRADPYDVSDTYPHSGNGVTQECFIPPEFNSPFMSWYKTKEAETRRLGRPRLPFGRRFRGKQCPVRSQFAQALFKHSTFARDNRHFAAG